jgi:site-specific recombinase XerD
LLPSERKNADGSAARVGDETLRAALASAARAHRTGPEVVTPHVLRHFCASQLYLADMDLLAIQAALGHAWVATTMMNYVHVPATHIEDAWITGQQRAADRLRGLRR